MFNETQLTGLSATTITGSSTTLSAGTHSKMKYTFSGNGRFWRLIGNHVFENCVFTSKSGSTANSLFLTKDDTDNVSLTFINCKFVDLIASGSTSSNLIYLQGNDTVIFDDCLFTGVSYNGSSATNALICNDDPGKSSTIKIINTDFSGITSKNQTYGLVQTAASNNCTITIINSTLPANEKIVDTNATLILGANVTFNANVNVDTITVNEFATVSFNGVTANNWTKTEGGEDVVVYKGGSLYEPEWTEGAAATSLRVGKNSKTFTDVVADVKDTTGVVLFGTASSGYTGTVSLATYTAEAALHINGQSNNVTMNGTYIANGNKTIFDNVKFADNSRVYGGETIVTGASFGGAEVKLENVTMNSKTRVYGGCDVATEDGNVTGNGNIKTTIDVTSGTVVLYGGARVIGDGSGAYSGNITLGTIDTTIESGNFTGYAGNGSQASNGNVTQGKSTLTINGGNFKEYVYAGAYSQGASVTVDGTELNITGGTFQDMVFGGCAANTNKQARTTKVNGDIDITITATSAIDFQRHLVAGSQSCKDGANQVLGNTTITFEGGTGSNITFADDSYILGGSQLDAKNSCKSISGSRNLVFDNFTSNDFNACFDNTFDTVSFNNGATVAFTGLDVNLSDVSTWNFDVSSDVELTWLNGKNNFNGDTINLNGWDGETSRTFMFGSADTLKNFNAENFNVYTAADPEHELTSGYSITKTETATAGKFQLTLAKA